MEANKINRIIALLIILAIPVSASTSTSDASGILKEAVSNQEIKRVARLLDIGKDKEAKQELDRILEIDPDNNEALYQLARYELGAGYTVNNTIVGYRYRPQAARSAIRNLKKVIELEPDHGRANSLLGHVYAVQGNLKQAEVELVKAAASKKHIPWFNINKAVMYIQRKDYASAQKLLDPIIQKQPRGDEQAELNRYSTAWRLSKKLGLVNTNLDPNPNIRNGLFKRVMENDIQKYIADGRHKKPLFVHFTSDDPWCRPCERSNQMVAGVVDKFSDQVEFVRVSFEPRNTIRANKNLNQDFSITNVPAMAMFHRGKLVALHRMSLESAGVLDYFIEDTLETISIRGVDRFEGVNDNVARMLLSFPFKRTIGLYLSTPAKRALAVAISPRGEWWTDWPSDMPDQVTASAEAMRRCEKFRIKKGMKQECVLFLEGSDLVFGGASPEVLATLKDDILYYRVNLLRMINKEFKQVYKRYGDSKEQYKALALALGDDDNWQTGWTFGASSKRQAQVEALNDCEKRNKGRSNAITQPCKLYAINNSYVYWLSKSQLERFIIAGKTH